MGSTFNQALLREAGELMGRETIAKGAHVLLGPCINMQRSPLGGRGFESLSEDPVVAGLGAAALIRGIEGTGVVACIKHFVCNDQEHQRTLYNAIVTDRALREIYLKPFQIATRDAPPAMYMTAYNKVNGTHASENPVLLQMILREEWGWEGLVMSDWHGTYSTTEAVEAGLDLEMPGPSRWRKNLLSHAVASGKLSELTVDERVRAVLRLVDRCTASKVPENAPEGKIDTPETAAFLRRIASESLVLLKNTNNVLPLQKDKSTLMIGPNVQSAIYCGGGSSSLPAYYTVSPWQGVASKLPPSTPISHVIGTYTHKELPLLGPHLTNAADRPGFDMKVYNSPPSVPDRELAEHIQMTNTNMFLMDFASPRVLSPLWYATVTGRFTPTVSGVYDFGLCVYGTADLYIDDKLLIDNTTHQKQGTVFYGCGTVEEGAHIHLEAGTPYSVRVEFASAPTNTLRGGGIVRFGGGGVRIGCARQIDAEGEMVAAVAAAKAVDQVVIVAALGPDWETEGHDRADMRLPGEMDRLIAEVGKVNPNTVVVLQTGTPVEMPWIENIAGVLQAWYGGNEAGNAVADVLFGDVNPSGKLSLSFPRRVEDNPAYLNYRSEGGRTLYGEDVYVGYRYYESVKREVGFPFGWGLSYTTFALLGLGVEVEKGIITVMVTLENSGEVPGAEVVQVYIAPTSPGIRRAPKELQGFTKEFLQPGERREATISMPLKYATSYWDESRSMWKCEKDTYRVLVGTSSRGPFEEGMFEVEETFWWKGL
jgi:beta-glucosidase